MSQFYGSVQPIFYESSPAHAPLLRVFLCADSFHRPWGKRKNQQENQKGREKQFAVRIQTSTKSGWRQGLEPAINKIGPHTSAALSTTPAAQILHTSTLFYDSVQVSIFFSAYRLRTGLLNYAYLSHIIPQYRFHPQISMIFTCY